MVPFGPLTCPHASLPHTPINFRTLAHTTPVRSTPLASYFITFVIIAVVFTVFFVFFSSHFTRPPLEIKIGLVAVYPLVYTISHEPALLHIVVVNFAE